MIELCCWRLMATKLPYFWKGAASNMAFMPSI